MPTKLPRLNVTITSEQHGLLLELAKLNGGSAAGYLRQMLDAATPLLRETVPLLRAASEEMELTREQVSQLLQPLRDLNLREAADQLDLLDHEAAAPMARNAASGRERGRANKRAANA